MAFHVVATLQIGFFLMAFTAFSAALSSARLVGHALCLKVVTRALLRLVVE